MIAHPLLSANTVPGMRGGPSSIPRRLWFAEHVPWHRVRSVVDVSDDSGRLLSEVMDDFDGSAVLVDLAGNATASRALLARCGDRVSVRSGDLLTELPAGADFYLLPDGLEDLDSGRLGRLMRAVSQACLPSGRALACMSAAGAATVVRSAERAGLEVTRRGGDATAALIEFGSGPLRVLPGQ
ncbi:methyltransferase [Nakamurella lactea]|uniref:methyltransferase n=1 Tax=Nakamurella lactea TaxID=459515 RepID=UPI0003FAC4E0|nr:methyltransferase [Nakamurella lactea]